MGKKDKLYKKAKESPENLSFTEICSLAEHAGSHKIYKHPKIKKMLNFQPDKRNKSKAKKISSRTVGCNNWEQQPDGRLIMFKYSINLTWSDEDNCYVATVSEFPGLSAFGDTPEEAAEEASPADSTDTAE